MNELTSRRNLLAAAGLIAALGVGIGATRAAESSEVTTVSFNAQNLRGYWASTRDNGRGAN